MLRRGHLRTALALICALALALPALAQAAKGAKKGSEKQYYVSLGDSSAEGYQPSPAGGLGGSTKDGFAYVLPKLAKKRGYDLKLVNFACGGETSASILQRTTACPGPGSSIGGPDYSGRTQAAAAEKYIRKHRRDVGLITVSIGANDLLACVNQSDPVGCAVTGIETVKTNLATLVQGLRSAAGPQVKIIGVTYPNSLLGLWVNPGSDSDRGVAALSVGVFRDSFNPALKQGYESVGGVFVDVTAATGAYIPLDQTTVLAPYGEIPVAVATACNITWYCALRDIHPNAAGYGEMAQLIADALPKKGKK